MDNVIKQRILGIIVLLALIGICITILLHNNDNTNIRHTSHHYTLPTSTPTPTVINQAPAPVQSIQQQPTQQLTPQATQPIQNQTPMTQVVRPQEPITPIISNVMSKTSPQNIPATLIHQSKIKHTPAAGNFTVQAGTFSKAQNAEKLVKTLQSRGFTSAKTQSVHTKKGTMTRVIVGNQLSVDSAKSLQQQLKQKLNLNGFAVLETPKSVKQKTTQQHANHPKKTSDPVITEVTIP